MKISICLELSRVSDNYKKTFCKGHKHQTVTFQYHFMTSDKIVTGDNELDPRRLEKWVA